MNKKLAIVGHPTRGNEVIELLEMMGGVNSKNLDGKCDFLYFFINNDNIIWCDSNFNNNFVYFTLEKFLKENPYKIGDKVMGGKGKSLTIKSMSWSTDCETMVYDFEETEDVFCAEDLEAVNDTNEVFLKIEKNTNMNIEFDLIKYSYEVKDGKLVISEKKPKYPDNYEECVRIAKNIHGYDIHIDVPAYGELMESFVKLLICQDAYWKIAGEEMGLGKPWEPNWQKTEERKFCIIRRSDNAVTKWETKSIARFLAFPTEEIRDIFYENFKDLIEQCKSLL